MFKNDLKSFVERNELPESSIDELLDIFNAGLIAVGTGILNNAGLKKDSVIKKEAGGSKLVGQKWASKTAESYAQEQDVTLDDFPGVVKVTKPMIVSYIKNKPVKNPVPNVPKGKDKIELKKKVQCNGLTIKGEPCTRTATMTPGGSKMGYCFKHCDAWRDFECSDDVVSSDSGSDSEPNVEIE
jgi:hypothetical protein